MCSCFWSPRWHSVCGHAGLPAVAGAACGHQPQGGSVNWDEPMRHIALSQDTDKQVKNTPFPSITICTEGINMDAIRDAVSEDFNVWLKEKRNYTYLAANHIFTQREHRNNVKEFLHDTYSISPSYNISLEDIALAYSSPDPEKYSYSSSNKNQRFRS